MDHLTTENSYDPTRNKSFQKFINSNKPSVNTSEIKYPEQQEPDNFQPIFQFEDTQPPSNHPPLMESNIPKQKKPKLNVMSIILSEKKKEQRHCDNIWDSLYNMKGIQDTKRVEALTQKAEQENQQILKDCTFTPKIDKSIIVETTKDIFERTLMWKHSVESKLAEKKRTSELSKLADCKFSPNIETSKVMPNTVINTKGVPNFYKRMKDAKLSNDFKKQRLNKCTGSKWKKQTTISTPYNLSTSNILNERNAEYIRSSSPKKEINMIDEIHVNDTLPLEIAQSALHKKLLSLELD